MATARHNSAPESSRLPYGAMSGANNKLRVALARYGVRYDEDWPDLPEFDARVPPPSPEDACFAQELRRVVEQLLDTITPRESSLLRLRYGIGRTQDHTIAEVAEYFDLTRSRILQIESNALRKLRGNRDKDWQLAGIMEKGEQQ